MASSSRTWHAFLALSWAERRLLGRACMLLPLTSIGLLTLGFRRTQVVLSRAGGAPNSRVDHAAAQSVARIVRGAANWSPLYPSCLARSLVLCRLLRLQGLDGELRIGVRKLEGRFTAHAWVEHGGAALNDRADVEQRFATFGRPLSSGWTDAQ